MFVVELKVEPDSLAVVNDLVEKYRVISPGDTSFVVKLYVRGPAIQQLCSLSEAAVDCIIKELTVALEQKLSDIQPTA